MLWGNHVGGPIFTDLVVKSMGKRGEREKVVEADTHLVKNMMNTRKTHKIQGRLLPNGSHRSDRILARKDRSTCSLKSTSEREEHLEEGLDDLGARNREPKALFNDGCVMQSPIEVGDDSRSPW